MLPYCIASLAPTNVGVTIAAQDSCSITTLTSNDSPPTSPTRLPAGILRVTTLVSAFLHRLSDLALAAWVDVGEWIVPGPAVVLRGKGGMLSTVSLRDFFFWQAD